MKVWQKIRQQERGQLEDRVFKSLVYGFATALVAWFFSFPSSFPFAPYMSSSTFILIGFFTIFILPFFESDEAYR